MQHRLTHIKLLESESVYVIREAAAQFKNAFLLFSGGKDSVVLLHLVRKAFWPGKIPFTLLHIDSGHNFPETLTFRDSMIKKMELKLMVAFVQDSIDSGMALEETGYCASRNVLQTVTLMEVITKNNIDAAIGGARRDEDKSRAKERFFSFRDSAGHWDPRNQRPELWRIFNGRKNSGEHFRVFPLNNWTEMDIWYYILMENLEMMSLYFSHNRDCFIRNGMIYAYSDFIKLKTGEQVQNLRVRFRTIGDMTCSGAMLSTAGTVKEIIDEMAVSHKAERSSRLDDRRSDTSMEDRKSEGYF